MTNVASRKISIALAASCDRRAIYTIRHDVYARELGQHATKQDEMLSDALDEENVYIKAEIEGELAGFISITPPSAGRYSIEKYVSRNDLPVSLDERTYEIRLLTVCEAYRHSHIAANLMYAAVRWVEEQGGEQIIMMGRTEILNIYLSYGAKLMGRQVKSGNVLYELMTSSVSHVRGFVERYHARFAALAEELNWEMSFPYFKPTFCFHGGAFFEAIGADFATLERHESILNADVLDAWFPPSPRVLESLREHLPWLVRTSPPTQCEGLREAIAMHRGVTTENILPGAGSSGLIYLAFPQWLDASSRVLILDPSYAEYAHVLEKVIGCHVDRMTLSRREGYEVDLDELGKRLQQGYDLVVLVNPNNPTGRHIPRKELEAVLRSAPVETRVWIDEAYVDYVSSSESMESFAAASENVIVCKSMSKAYALSGMRVGYLCAGAQQLAELFRWTPPWAIGLPAQVAAVRALEDKEYYEARYRETSGLRDQMAEALRGIGIEEIVPGAANFLMFHVGEKDACGAELVQSARQSGVFLRDVSNMGTGMGRHVLRIAIKDEQANAQVVEAVRRGLARGRLRDRSVEQKPSIGSAPEYVAPSPMTAATPGIEGKPRFVSSI